MVYDDHPIAEHLRLLHVVSGEDEGLLPLFQLRDVVPESMPALRVQAGGGLVQVEDGRIGDQRPGHEQAALHASGELMTIFCRVLIELGPRNGLTGLQPRFGTGEAAQPGVEVEVLGNAQVRVKAGLLRGDAEEAFGLDGILEDVVTSHGDRAR